MSPSGSLLLPTLGRQGNIKKLQNLHPLGMLRVTTDQEPQQSPPDHKLMTKTYAQEVRKLVSRLYPAQVPHAPNPKRMSSISRLGKCLRTRQTCTRSYFSLKTSYANKEDKGFPVSLGNHFKKSKHINIRARKEVYFLKCTDQFLQRNPSSITIISLF